MNETVILPNDPQRNIYGPLTPSQMFEGTFAVLRESPKLFFGIAAVLIGVEIVMGGVLSGSDLWVAHSSVGAAPIARMLVTVPLALLSGLIIYLVTQIVQGALFLATSAKLARAPMSVGEACRQAAEHIGRLVGISVLVALRIFGYMVLLYVALAIPVVILAAIFGMMHSGGSGAYGFAHGATPGHIVLLGILVLVLLVVYVIAMFWLSARYAVSIPAALQENLSVTEAIRRSIQLTRESKGRLYALFAAILVFYIVLVACTLPIQLMAMHSAQFHTGVTPARIGVIMMLLSIFEYVVYGIVLTFVGVAATLCYFDLRARKEGFGAPAVTPVPAALPMAPTATPDWPIEDIPIS